MKMVIGGAFQGKTHYAARAFSLAEDDFIDGAKCSTKDLYRCRAVKHFHEYIRRMVSDGIDLSDFAAELIEKNPDIVIVTNELGYGVVPMDAMDRKVRETDGRICEALAAFSNEVHRVSCGLGIVIKKTAE